MTEYRFYQIDRKGRIGGPPTVVECEDDDAALVEVSKLAAGSALEIWAGPRKVAFIPAPLEPLSSRSVS